MTFALAPITASATPPASTNYSEAVPVRGVNSHTILADQFAASSHDEAQKVHQTNQQAILLFQRYNKHHELIDVAKQFGLEIYDGGIHSWVDAYCLKEGVGAFIYTPHSKRYPGYKSPEISAKEGLKTSVPWYDFITHTLDKKWQTVETNLTTQKKAALFFRKDAPPADLMHELFHVLQEKNGLPFGVNPEADTKANQFSNELNQPTFSSIMKRSALLVLVTLNSFVKPLQEPKTDVAKSLYYQMKREIEVDKFIMNYGHVIGISSWQQLKHVLHYFVESQFKLRLSNLIDQPYFSV